jgi:tetratricopeptide (TPR) repeat protein
MRSKIFVSGIAIALGLGSPIAGATVADAQNIAPSKIRPRKSKPKPSEAKRLIKQGRDQKEKGNSEAAIELFKNARLLAQTNNQKDLEATALVELGETYAALKQPQVAIGSYREAISLYQSIQSFDDVIDTLYEIVRIHTEQKEIEQILIVLDEVERIALTLKDKQKLDSLARLSRRYQRLGLFDKSLKIGQDVLDLSYRLKVTPKQSKPILENDDDDDERDSDKDSIDENKLSRIQQKALITMSVSAYALNDKNSANRYSQILMNLPIPSQKKSKERVEISRFSDLAESYYDFNYDSEAIAIYEKALNAAKLSGNKSQAIGILGEVATIYSEVGPYSKEVKSYREIQTIASNLSPNNLEEDDDDDDEIPNFNEISIKIGIASYRLGLYPEAVRSFENIISKSNQAKKSYELKVLFEAKLYLSLTHYAIGDYTKSEAQSLSILKSLNSSENKTLKDKYVKRVTSQALDALGEVYRIRKNNNKAIEYYNKALQYADNSSLIRSKILNHLGLTYQTLDRVEEAINLYQNSVDDFQSERNLWDLSNVLHNLGSAYGIQKKYDRSLTYYQKSLALRQQIGDRQGEATTFTHIAQLLNQQNQPELAIVFYKKSISIYENIRLDNRALPQDQQESYVKTVEKTYRDLADLLLKNDRILEAQQILDLIKVQELNNYLKNVRSASQVLENLPPETEILKKYSVIQTNAIALGQELTTLRQTPELTRSAQQKQRITQLTQLEEDLNRQFNDFADRPDIQQLTQSLSPKVRIQTIDTADLNGLRVPT